MKQQLNIRVSDATKYQLDQLCQMRTTTQTEVIAIAIDRMYREEKTQMETRKLTELEIELFPGDASVDAAIQRHGTWYYADSNPTADDPAGLADAQFVTDEDSEYIPVQQARVRCGFHGLDLVTGWDGADLQDVDLAASARQYANLVLKRLTEQYPGAEIAVPYDLDASGALPRNFMPAVNDQIDHPEVPFVEQIAADVYEGYAWIVNR